MKRIYTVVGLLIIVILLPILASCQEYEPTISLSEYNRIWTENRQKDNTISDLQRQTHRLEYESENCQFKYDNLKISTDKIIASLIPSIGTTGVVRGKLRSLYIAVGDNKNPLTRDRITLYFESGLSLNGFGNFPDYSCIKEGYNYQICYQEIRNPDREDEILLQVTSIKQCL